jgi:hypothetical protein
MMSRRFIPVLFLNVLMILTLVYWNDAQTNDIAVVVNANNPVNNVSLSDLRKMLNGTKRSWPSGKEVKLITRGPGCRERLALLHLLAMSEDEYKQYWTAEVFRGEVDAPPLVVPSVGMQREAILTFPQGLTLLSAGDVKPGMKMIRVDGLMPGDAGYTLH